MVAVTTLDVVEKPEYTITQLELVCGGQRHEVWHYWYSNWPDHGVPTDNHGRFFTKELIQVHRATLLLCYLSSDSPPCWLVLLLLPLLHLLPFLLTAVFAASHCV